MGNESHREYNNKNKISEPMIVNQNHWSWYLVFVVCLYSRWFCYPLVLKSCFLLLNKKNMFVFGFGYPLVLKSWFSLFLFVLSMALATHWFWNLGFLFLCLYYLWFWLSIGSEILVLAIHPNVCTFDGYPLVLASWLSWFYQWLLVTHWSVLVNMCMLKVLFRHNETTHKLENVYMA